MADATVREIKRADELKPGDWFWMGDSPAEILLAETFDDHDGRATHLTYRFQTSIVRSKRFSASDPLMPVQDDELAAAREQAERAEKIASIRAFADWLEANPWAPTPYHLNASEHFEAPRDVPDGATGVTKVREVAARLGAKTDESLDDRTTVTANVGRFEYRLVAWHKDGRPAEPAPEPVAEPVSEAR